MRMNGSCAGGTGAFIDEIASVLKVPVEQFNELAQKGIKIQFKLIPDEQGLSWETVKNNLKKGE